jgi:hypothetical protein
MGARAVPERHDTRGLPARVTKQWGSPAYQLPGDVEHVYTLTTGVSAGVYVTVARTNPATGISHTSAATADLAGLHLQFTCREVDPHAERGRCLDAVTLTELRVWARRSRGRRPA